MTTTTIRPISPLTTTGVIKAKHPVREDFASWSTGSGCGYYYPTKGHAVKAFDTALKAYDLCLNENDLSDFHGDTGRKSVAVHNEWNQLVGWAIISWYRMPSGNYEFTGYLA